MISGYKEESDENLEEELQEIIGHDVSLPDVPETELPEGMGYTFAYFSHFLFPLFSSGETKGSSEEREKRGQDFSGSIKRHNLARFFLIYIITLFDVNQHYNCKNGFKLIFLRI